MSAAGSESVKRSLGEDAAADSRPAAKREKLESAGEGSVTTTEVKTKTGEKKKKTIIKTTTVKKVVPKSARTKQLEAEVKNWQEVAAAFLETSQKATPEQFRDYISGIKDQFREVKKRESELVVRLTQKEKDIYNLEAQQKELTEITNKKTLQMRTTFMDPLINENFRHMQEVVEDSKRKLQKAEDDLKAMQFDPSQSTGRQLIAKCRQLQEENEEAYKKLADSESARTQQQLKAQQSTMNEHAQELEEGYEFLLQVDTELEAKQDQIFTLLEQLNELKRDLEDLQHDNKVLKEELELANGGTPSGDQPQASEAASAAQEVAA